MFKRLKVKKGDTVKVLAGGSKGKQGTVIMVDRKSDRVKIEGVNMVKKHVKPGPANPQGGIESVEAAIHVSNVMVVDAAGNASSYSANLVMVVDTTRPTAPLISGSPLAKNSSTPTLSGTAEALAVVKLYSGTSLVATTTADQYGAWSVAPSSLVDQPRQKNHA